MSRKFGLREIALFTGTAGVVAAGVLFLSRSTHEPSSSAESRHEPAEVSHAGRAQPALAWRTSEEWKAGIEACETGGLPSLALAAMAIDDDSLRSEVLVELTRAWLDRDIPAFLEFIDELEVDETDDSRMWKLLAPALMTALPQISDHAAESVQLRVVIERLIVNYAPQDPTRALEWARQWLYDRELHAAIVEIAPELARTSPAEGIALADSLPPSLRRMEAFAAVGAVVAETNPALAIATANRLRNPAESAFMMGSVLRTIASFRPHEAATEFAAFRDRLESEFAAQLERDRAELDTNAETEFFGLSEEDAKAAVRNSPNAEYLDDAAIAIATSWATSDVPGALSWAGTLPEGRLRTEATAAVYRVWARQAPAAALEHYVSTGQSTPAVAETLFDTWAESDPTAAAAAIPRLAGPDRLPSVEAVTRSWIEADENPETVQNWAETLPNATERDAATAIVVEAAAFDHPEFALEKAQVIQNPRKRRMALQDAFESLADSDPATARSMLSRLQLSPEQAQDFALILNASED
jgi:hypothetical protein